MVYRFENLEIWKLAREYANLIYSVTKQFPKEELFALSNQLRRAGLSVMLNITEGSDRKSELLSKKIHSLINYLQRQ
ncbi:MAG: four helix bundle protein [Candidatus Magasanikbacteria bacterium]|nr:four helix bundle protein [Candidatus Magasanikbacteria bacterium]